MITSKQDVKQLKAKHFIELVMQETGESFEVVKPDQWRGKNTPGLLVDTRRQTYELARPGMDTESGDVIAWLQRRYSWSFAMAKSYLEKRAADPIHAAQPVKVVDRKPKNKIQKTDFVTITHEYINPKTGSRSYAGDYNYDLMDKYQRSAFEIAGDWVSKYFSNSSDDLWALKENYPHRFKQVIDFEVEKCAHCETLFNWQDPQTFAYAHEEKKSLDVLSDDEAAEYMQIRDEIFIDTDLVVCEKCARGVYAPKYKALLLAWRSARKHEQAERAREVLSVSVGA